MMYRRVIRDYKQRSRINGTEFSLTEFDFINLIKQNCYYCNSEVSNLKTISRNDDTRIKGKTIKYNGLDRIDNTKGYIIDNVRPCCSSCNVMKLTLTETEFFDKIKAIYNLHLKDAH